MQLHQLEYFVAVAETGGFTRGAERVRIVQSAVSAGVRQLERELDCALFERGRQGVTLTAEGEALLPRARDALAAVVAARDAVAGARGDLAGTVTLGTMSHVGAFDVAAVLQRFHERFPRVVVQLRQTAAGSRTSIEQVRSGALDLALVSPLANTAPGIRFDDILSEPLLFVCWPGHPLADRDRVRVTDAANEAFVDFPSGWGNRTAADRLFESAGLVRSIQTEVTDFALARDLVQRRLGVTILPASGVPEGAGLVALPLVGAPEWTVRLARPSERRLSPAASRLAEELLAEQPRPDAP